MQERNVVQKELVQSELQLSQQGDDKSASNNHSILSDTMRQTKKRSVYLSANIVSQPFPRVPPQELSEYELSSHRSNYCGTLKTTSNTSCAQSAPRLKRSHLRAQFA